MYRLFDEADIDPVAALERERLEKWIAIEVQSGKRTPQTICHYLAAAKSFSKFLVDSGILSADSFEKIRKDRCFTPNFKIEMNDVNAYLSQWNLTAESFPECFEDDGYSIRRIFESLRDLELEPTVWDRNAITPDNEDGILLQL